MGRPGRFGILLVSTLAGCTEFYPAYPQVPPPRAERVPEPPKSTEALSWRPGYYQWVDERYAWIPGEWVPAAGHSKLWQDGYWQRTGFKTYQWVQPGWK